MYIKNICICKVYEYALCINFIAKQEEKEMTIHHYIQLFSMQKPENLLQNLFVLQNIHVHCLQNLSNFQQTLENEIQSTVSMVSVLSGQVAFSLFTSSKFENLCWNFGFQSILMH